MENLERYVAEHPFLAGMEERHIKLITGCASNVVFKEGERVFREGEPADRFFFIRHGRLALEIYHPHKGGISVQTVTDGQVLGWAWLVPPHRRNYDCRAVELTRAIALDGACLRQKAESDHELGYQIMKRFAQVAAEELQSTRMQLLDLYGIRG